MATENALYTILIEKINQNALVLPTLPKIALQIRDAADDPEANLNKMSDIIARDPALSVGMLKVANSAALGRSIKVETVNQAVTRIGLQQIKSISTAMVLEQVFISENESVKKYMSKAWDNTVKISAVAIALMTYYLKDNKHTSLRLDTLTLAALIHNIGTLPILTEAENHPEVFANPTFLQQAIAKLSNSVGKAVIDAWGFSEDFSYVVENWSDLSKLPSEVHYIDFIRAGAIATGTFKSESTQKVLLNSYVKKGILPNDAFLKDEDFNVLVQEIKETFS